MGQFVGLTVFATFKWEKITLPGKNYLLENIVYGWIIICFNENHKRIFGSVFKNYSFYFRVWTFKNWLNTFKYFGGIEMIWRFMSTAILVVSAVAIFAPVFLFKST